MRLITVRIVLTLVLGILVVPLGSNAQQPAKVVKIGFLGGSSASDTAAALEALRQGLRGLGYVEGQNSALEQRYAEGQADRLPSSLS